MMQNDYETMRDMPQQGPNALTENGDNTMQLLLQIDARIARLERMQTAQKKRRIWIWCIVLAVLIAATAVLLPGLIHAVREYQQMMTKMQQLLDAFPPEQVEDMLAQLQQLFDALAKIGELGNSFGSFFNLF